jgi:hypothetical protein
MPDVTGVRHITGSGDFSRRTGVALLAEGFTAAQSDRFDQACDELVRAFLATPPLDRLADAVAFTAIQVASREGGIAMGRERDTAFRAFLGFRGVAHLLHLEWKRASSTANEHAPHWDAVVVIANTTSYGGTANGGGVCALTLCPGWERLAIHELGHVVFELADEYDYPYTPDAPGSQRPTGPLEPAPNVTQDLAGLKWRALLSGNESLPTTENPHRCERSDDRPRPDGLAAEHVGAFEGAQLHPCGVWRPQHTCLMREIGEPFCRVCSDAIEARLSPVLASPQTS